jgi:enoyl reductase-like protein
VQLNWTQVEVLWFTVKSAAVCTVAIVGGIGAAFLGTLTWNALARAFGYPTMPMDGAAAIAGMVATLSLVATVLWAMANN